MRRLWPGPYIVGRLGSGPRVVPVLKFSLLQPGNVLDGEGNCPGGANVRGGEYVRGSVLHSVIPGI